MDERGLSPDPAALSTAWNELVGNFDTVLATAGTREHLRARSAPRFQGLRWRKPLERLLADYPNFFSAYDYRWCADEAVYDFPIEAQLQVRLLSAAIGIWGASHGEKPTDLNLHRLVARVTYLGRFDQVTPHVQPHAGFQFVVTPAGWLDFLRRYFSGFAIYRNTPGSDPMKACHANWTGIAANLVSSAVNSVEWALPAMVRAIIRDVPRFHGADSTLKLTDDTDLSAHLAHAAHDFALCHELAHVAAADFAAPDEERADSRALAAYLHGPRPKLYGDLIPDSGLNAVIAPFAFASAVRSLLAARAYVFRQISMDAARIDTRRRGYARMAERSRALWRPSLIAATSLSDTLDEADFDRQLERVQVLLGQLLDYEERFVADGVSSIAMADYHAAVRAALQGEHDELAANASI